MEDPEHTRRKARDTGLDAVNRWTRRAVAGGIVLCGALGIGLAHLLPGQASETHETPSPTSEPSTSEPTTQAPDDSDDSSPTVLKPPTTRPRPSHSRSHATSGGS